MLKNQIHKMIFFDYTGIMKKIMFLIISLYVIGAQAADAGACYSIADSDARAYCRAKAHRDPSICYSIKASDIRSQCLAEVRK